jgi:DnaJ family protein C protein 28
MSDIDDSIKQAMQTGQFDNLPGKGKPLNLDENPFADPEWELAHHVLKNSGFTLPWIETRQQIEKELAEARADLKRAWEWRQSAAAQNTLSAQVELQWQQSSSAFREKIVSLNKRIRDYNLQAPSDRFHLLVLNGEKEIASIVSA